MRAEGRWQKAEADRAGHRGPSGLGGVPVCTALWTYQSPLSSQSAPVWAAYHLVASRSGMEIALTFALAEIGRLQGLEHRRDTI